MKLALLLILILISSPVFSASFDCNKAESDAEVMVCATNNLSMADDVLGQLYHKLVKDNPSLREEQRRWIRDVRDAATSPEELQDVYSERIRELLTTKPAVVEPKKIEKQERKYTKQDFEETLQGVALIDHCYSIGYPVTDLSEKTRTGLVNSAKSYPHYDKQTATDIYDEKTELFETMSRYDGVVVCNSVYEGMRKATIGSRARADF